ncbi:hypothetical protein M0L20_29300 [Spirosoma sp. RP8]|uniref:Chromosome partitioning protein ParB n=1 Tax=Spirosoma liriopis TaxID=2937440 RepID=A0ABT0HWK0_9BACT|nr:hypothetical protein [Spirosoma liriopis]MCK8495998.1 hypothetical protein [Spirosoma liriopis]
MAKEKLGLKSSLGLSPKVEIKKSEIDVEQTEKAVKEIHSKKPEVHRLTIDLPMDLYKAMKIKILGESSVRDHIIKLVSDDLKK